MPTRRTVLSLGLAGSAIALSAWSAGSVDFGQDDQGDPTPRPPAGTWLLISNGRPVSPSGPGRYSVDLSGPVDLFLATGPGLGTPGDQAALVFNTIRVSRYAADSAASRIFINRFGVPLAADNVSASVPLNDYINFHLGFQVERSSARILRFDYHVPLATAGGRIFTSDFKSKFLLAEEVAAERADNLIRTSTILKIVIPDAARYSSFSTGHYSPDILRVYLMAFGINITAPPVSIILDHKNSI